MVAFNTISPTQNCSAPFSDVAPFEHRHLMTTRPGAPGPGMIKNKKERTPSPDPPGPMKNPNPAIGQKDWDRHGAWAAQSHTYFDPTARFCRCFTFTEHWGWPFHQATFPGNLCVMSCLTILAAGFLNGFA